MPKLWVCDLCENGDEIFSEASIGAERLENTDCECSRTSSMQEWAITMWCSDADANDVGIHHRSLCHNRGLRAISVHQCTFQALEN